MNHLSMPTATRTPVVSPRVAETQLHGARLLIARSVWVVLACLSVGWFITSVLVYYLGLHGFHDGAYAHLIHTTAVISGYSSIMFHYVPFTGTFAILNVTLMTILAPLWIAVGLVIFWRRSDDWMALFVALVLVLAGTNFSPTSYVLSIALDPTLLLEVLSTCVQALGWSSLVLFFAIFPNGRFVPGWTRWVILAYLACQLSLAAPSNWSFSVVHWPALLFAFVMLGLFLPLTFAQLYRYRFVSTALERQQTKWIVFGMTLGSLADMVNLLPAFVVPALNQPGPVHVLYSVFGEGTLSLFLLVPLAIGFAVLRYRLWDIDILINRTLVYGLLTASVIGLYLLVVVGLGTLLSVQGNLLIALLATGLIAVLFQPLRERLQRAVNRLMFGERDEPYRVISRLGSRLEATLAPDAVLPTIVETVAQALKLPYAALTLKQEQEFVIVASYGTLRSEVIRLPLVYQSEQLGELVLASRGPSESFTPADRALLVDMARQAGVAAYAVCLTTDLKRLTLDLQRSREHLVTAREEERRRLRRDLHDGLGPQLATLTLKLETARNRLTHDPLADPLFADLTTRTQAAITDIRRLVYALRPPALDELGLLAALREQAIQYGDQVHIHLDIPERLPPLSAALEVALYRVTQEALTNVVRHAHATHCNMHLVLDEQASLLRLDIQDDGCGLPTMRKVGVGLVSMRERAEELGGTWLIEPSAAGGTHILMQLPYRSSETTDTLLIGTPAQSEEG